MLAVPVARYRPTQAGLNPEGLNPETVLRFRRGLADSNPKNIQETFMKFILAIAVILCSGTVWGAEPPYESESEKLSYSIGYQVGVNLLHNVRRDEIDVDVEALTQAIKDVFTETEPRMSAEDRQAAVKAFREKTDKRRAETAQRNEQLSRDFLAANKSKPDIQETPSGLQYRVINSGTGPQPESTDTVVVHYRGTLMDGTEFDSSYRRNKPATLPLTGVIKGWQEAVPMMKQGAKWELFIPPQLAYGERGSGSRIGPNQALVFEVELLEVK